MRTTHLAEIIAESMDLKNTNNTLYYISYSDMCIVHFDSSIDVDLVYDSVIVHLSIDFISDIEYSKETRTMIVSYVTKVYDVPTRSLRNIRKSL